MKKNQEIMIGVIIAGVLFLILLFIGGNDEEQIAREIKNNWHVTNIQHIEIINNNKSVALFETVDGTEMEAYLEKTLFFWNIKRDFSFNPAGINAPIFMTFFNSPFSNEEEYNAVTIKVFDEEINSVQLVKGEDIIHHFNLFTKGPGEKIGLFRTESEVIYDAEYIAYNQEGEVVYRDRPQ